MLSLQFWQLAAAELADAKQAANEQQEASVAHGRQLFEQLAAGENKFLSLQQETAEKILKLEQEKSNELAAAEKRFITMKQEYAKRLSQSEQCTFCQFFEQ